MVRLPAVASLLLIAVPAQETRPPTKNPSKPGPAGREAVPRADQLIAWCGDLGDPDRRVAAMFELWRAGPPVVPLLVREVQRSSAGAGPALAVLAELGRDALPAAPVLERLQQTGAHRHHVGIGLALAAIGERDSITVSSYSGGFIAELDPDGKELRRLDLREVWSIDPLPGNRLLITELAGNEVREIDWTGAVHWRARVPNSPLDAHRLPDGTTVVACWLGRCVVWLDADGVELRRTEGIQAVDLEPLWNGHLLVCDYEGRRLVELDTEGEIAREFPVPAQPMDADVLPNGNLLVSWNHPNKLVEYERAGDALREVRQRDERMLPEDVRRLPDGRTVLAHSAGLSLRAADGQEVWHFACGHAAQTIVRLPVHR